MDILIKILQFLLSLSLLVLIHELGHYLGARIFGIRVDKFYLFFNPYFSIWKKKIGHTEYGLGWIPLGGYCKIAGMVDESMDKEQLEKEPQPWEYRSRPAWQRLIVILGGVLFNIILALVIYSMITFSWGEKYLPAQNVKDGVMVLNEQIAEVIDLKDGDKIVSIDGELPEKFFDSYEKVLLGREMVVERDGADLTLSIPVDFIDQYKQKGRGLFYYPRVPFIVGAVPDTSLNAKAGFVIGDHIVEINGQRIDYFDQAQNLLQENTGEKVAVKILRDQEIVFLYAAVSEEGKIELVRVLPTPKELNEGAIYPSVEKDYNFFTSFGRGTEIAGEKISSYLTQLKMLVNPDTGAYKSVGSVITMGNLFPSVWDWRSFWEITAILSIMLAVMNLLPIPALDGGHAVIILYEMVTRRKPSEKVLEYLQTAGFFIIIALMVFALGNDLLGVFKGWFK